jgi:hypothetical protein
MKPVGLVLEIYQAWEFGIMMGIQFMLLSAFLLVGCAQEKKKFSEGRKHLEQPVEVVVEKNFVDLNIDRLHSSSAIDAKTSALPNKSKVELMPTKQGEVLISKVEKWPQGRIPYAISSDFEYKSELEQAKISLSLKGIILDPKKSSDIDFINLKIDKNATKLCSSSELGMKGGEQEVLLAGLSAPFFKNCKIVDMMVEAITVASGKSDTLKPIENLSVIKPN